MCSVTYFNGQVVHLPCYCRNNSTCGSVNVSIVLLYVAPSFAGAVRGDRVGRKPITQNKTAVGLLFGGYELFLC